MMIPPARKKTTIILLICAVMIMIITIKHSYTIPYVLNGIRLSELSNLECVEYVASKGVEMTYNYKTSIGFQELTKDLIIRYEQDPYKVLYGTYGSLSTNIYAEEVRKVVNNYYGIYNIDYYPEIPPNPETIN